ncbi:Cob(I)yrinic acid a,c-diamide adenosyltransferase [Nymphon striatum]|nr:Cob(I)yrinic acid a,c-diamide adenosyltransferase [Nymphon striatum]
MDHQASLRVRRPVTRIRQGTVHNRGQGIGQVPVANGAAQRLGQCRRVYIGVIHGIIHRWCDIVAKRPRKAACRYKSCKNPETVGSSCGQLKLAKSAGWLTGWLPRRTKLPLLGIHDASIGHSKICSDNRLFFGDRIQRGARHADMVVLNKIYTKTGDAGETALGNGSRVAKHSMRVTAYGTTDELNSVVGLARLHASDVMDERLSLIQNDLFDLGADLCRPDMEMDAEAEYPPLRMVSGQVDRLETEIDEMNGVLTPLRSFHFAGWISPVCVSASVSDCGAAGRASDSRIGDDGSGEPGRGEIPEPFE